MPLLYEPTVPTPLMVSTRVFLCFVLCKMSNLWWYQKYIDAAKNTLAMTFLVVDSALAAFYEENYVFFCVMKIDHHNL